MFPELEIKISGRPNISRYCDFIKFRSIWEKLSIQGLEHGLFSVGSISRVGVLLSRPFKKHDIESEKLKVQVVSGLGGKYGLRYLSLNPRHIII